MNLLEFQNWIKAYYEERGWAELDIFIRVGFLTEEAGEVARAVRALEIGRDRPDEAKQTDRTLKEDLVEELGDVLGNIITIANIYDIPLEHIFEAHKRKLLDRYKNAPGEKG